MNRNGKLSRAAALFLSAVLFFTIFFPQRAAAAPAWPDQTAIEAEGGILMDADSGCVIYGKNIHQQFFPASITKILTALIVIENCDLDDTITFSRNAVYNVEAGSTSAGYDTGDQITVREALYAMLLKSANEVANALAEHCAGSVEAFAEMMNQKAASLGCTDSHFVNPSGLNDPQHYTTPYDYALIAQAAFNDPTFVEFDSKTYYELPPNGTNASSFTVYCGHKMLKKNSNLYYPGIIGGKTGYTRLAGNTLVTCAERDGLRLITVILNGHQTHYTDTKTLLDFGFANFRNEKIANYDQTYTQLEEDIDLTGSHDALLKIDTARSVTLPKNAQFSDTTSEISYDLGSGDPDNAVARVSYLYNGRVAGHTWLCSEPSVSIEQPSGGFGRSGDGRGGNPVAAFFSGLREDLDNASLPGWLPVLIGIAALAALAAVAFLAQRIIADKAKEDLRMNESLRRLQQKSGSAQDGIYQDSSSSVDHYLKDTRIHSRRRSGGGGFFHKG